jgi:DNA-binding winged helix-turn-helix (wHTH) protein
MGIALLGPLVVNDGAVRLGSRDRTVLTALAMRPGEVLSAERLD